MDSNELEESIDLKIVDEKYLVAFLDILGYKDIVKDYVDKKTDILDKIKLALKDVTNTILKDLGNDSVNIKLNQFSDCTSIAINYKFILDSEDNEKGFIKLIMYSLVILSYFEIQLLMSDLYIRGGFSSGFHYENNNMIFSEGLINAYELESKAMHPRIILDDELANILKDLYKTHKNKMSHYCIDKILISDWDGLVFINPFIFSRLHANITDTTESEKHDAIERDKNMASSILKKVEDKIIKYKEENDYNILRKYIWFKELINWNIDENSSKIKFEYFLK